MAWGDRATDLFAVELVEKRPSLGRWLKATVDVLSLQTPDATAEFELLIKNKNTDAIVFTETYAGGVASDEAMRLAQERLEQMSVAEFCDTYSIMPE